MKNLQRIVQYILYSGFILLWLLITSCSEDVYEGSVIFSDYKWLKGKKIFLDPGHGGKGEADSFRIGPNGVTEEEINLKVALILNEMLEKAGVDVMMSRCKDEDIDLDDRVEMVKEFNPDLLISLHHNGSPRRFDSVNYPNVLIWGNKFIRPASFDFAKLLLNEFNKIIDKKGSVISDFSVFHETGTRILRKTVYVCPGVIGEAGFFSDKTHAKRLEDKLFNAREAEAYFYAIANYFKWGLPSAEVWFSCQMKNDVYLKNMIKDKNPLIAIKVDSGIEIKGIKDKTLKITLDGIAVRFKKLSDDLYLIRYGKKLYPGGHSIKFQFKNHRHRNSMVFRVPFTVEIKKGDYDLLINKGKILIKKKNTAKEGLKMLLSALSMGQTDPDAAKLLNMISKGFRIIGDLANAELYSKKLYYFYPNNKYNGKTGHRIYRYNNYRHPAEYNGKIVKIKSNIDIESGFKKNNKTKNI